MSHPLMFESVGLSQHKLEEAESMYHKFKAGTLTCNDKSKASSLVGELAQVRQDIHKALNKPPVGAAAGGDSSVYQRLDALERENKDLKKVTDELRAMILTIQASIGLKLTAAVPTPASTPASKSAPAAKDDGDDDDDDFDLFGDDDDEEAAEAAALKEKRVQEYKEKKSKKPALVAKSSLVLDVKPWDDETDMKMVENNVRKIKMDGLLWGAAKLVEVGYGIKKLVISCVVEDEKVSVEDLTDLMCEDEDHVQSVDIAAFNKV